jgi:hypothetical protein
MPDEFTYTYSLHVKSLIPTFDGNRGFDKQINVTTNDTAHRGKTGSIQSTFRTY